jgi:hypothetical protein
MIKYKIEGQYLDQFQDEQFAVTKAISKIGEIDLRHGDFSTTFKVPLTAKNVEILRYTPELNNRSNLDNFKRYNGQLVEDDAVISDGYYQVTGFNPTKKEASIKFLGGNSDWFDLLKDRYINIPIDSYNLDSLKHKFNFSNVTNSFNNTDNYVYFPFDNVKNNVEGKGKGNVTVDVFNVGVYSNTILNKIFNSVDIKLNGTFFNDAVYPSEIVPAIKTLEDFKEGDYQLGFSTTGGTQIQKGAYTPINFNSGNQDPQWNGSVFTSDSDADSIRFRLSFKASRGTTYGNNYGDLQLRVQQNGGTIDNRVLLIRNDFLIGGVFSVEYDIVDITVNNISQGDTFSFEVSNVNATTPPGVGFWSTEQGVNFNNAYLNFDLTNAINKYDIHTVLPKIKQSDFIKDIMFRYGVVSQYDVKTRTLTLDKFEGIDTNRILAPDWTNKIDLSKDVDVDYTKIIGSYAQNSALTYKDDSDNDTDLSIFKNLIPNGLGSGIINIDNDFIEKDKVIYTSCFSATSQRITGASDFYLPFMPIWEVSGEDSGTIQYEQKEIKPRVLLYAGNTPVIDINKTNENTVSIIDDNSQTQDFTSIGYAYFSKVDAERLDLNNDNLNKIKSTLNFDNYELTSNNFTGETIIERNYNLYQKILNDPIYVSLYMNLTALDVQQVDFITPIYLEYQYDSGYYYIDSIEQYKGDGTTTKINLVKI